MNDPSVTATSVTRLFTFGYGQTCPFTGEDLGDHYALVTAPDRSSALRTMLATFGRDWAFEYDPESPTIVDYIPRMTLHARLVIGAIAADPTGLAYTRADDGPDDPTPVSPARVPMHTGAVTDDGLVDESERDGCPVGPDGEVRHLLECAEDREQAELAAWPTSGWHVKGCNGAVGMACTCPKPSEIA